MQIEKVYARLDKVAANRPQLADRVERAREILNDHFNRNDGGKNRFLFKDTDAGRVYLVIGDNGKNYKVWKATEVVDGAEVTRMYCECPDFEHRRAGCKHSIAVYALEALYENEAAA